jgi:hypothetical protein
MRNSELGNRNGVDGVTIVPSVCSRGRRLRALVACIVCVLILGGTLQAADEPERDGAKMPEPEVRKKQKTENLKLMHERAAGSKIRLTDDETGHAAAELIASPLFHYTDQPRRIVDATLWGWISDGRMLANCKIENY